MFWTIRTYLFHIITLVVKLLPIKTLYHYDVVIIKIEALGDYVIWHDALSAYSKMFAGKRILLVCPNLNAPLAQLEELFTDIYVAKTKKFNTDLFYLLKVACYLRSVSAEIAYYPVWARHSIGDLLMSLVKAHQKIGYEINGKKILLTSFYDRQYSTLVRYKESVSEIGAIEYFTQQTVVSDYRYGLSPLILHTGKQIISSSDTPYIVLAFSSSIPQKIWEMEKFAMVIDSIPASYHIVLTGNGEDDIRRADQIMALIKDRNRITNLVNKTSVVDLVSLISKACLVIGNDSAAVHIAAATHVKSVCVLSGTHIHRFLPYPNNLPLKGYAPWAVYHEMDCFGCNYHCLHQDQIPFECIKRISVEEVIRVVMKLLTV